MSNFNTHYENLQVTRKASDSVIRAAYKALAQKYHPDKFDGSPAEAERIMKIVNEAYAVLSDPFERAQHDDWICSMESIAIALEVTSEKDASNPKNNARR